MTTTPDPRIRRHAARLSYYRHAVIQTSTIDAALRPNVWDSADDRWGESVEPGFLPAAEQLLQGLAKVEAATSPANGMGQVLPPPLAGRIALAALYRLWDALHQQLHLYYGLSGHRVAGATDSPHAHSVRVAAADLAVLGQAAHALAHPTEELAAALGRANLAHRDALTQLLVVLDPPTDQGDQTG
jgi:hypothetical protein